jgi:hypothetical protein
MAVVAGVRYAVVVMTVHRWLFGVRVVSVRLSEKRVNRIFHGDRSQSSVGRASHRRSYRSGSAVCAT